MSDQPGRKTVNAHATPFLPYDMEGPVQQVFVNYDAGTHHNSWTENGCLIAVFEWQRPDRHATGQ
jgi:hypothetical protein